MKLLSSPISSKDYVPCLLGKHRWRLTGLIKSDILQSRECPLCGCRQERDFSNHRWKFRGEKHVARKLFLAYFIDEVCCARKRPELSDKIQMWLRRKFQLELSTGRGISTGVEFVKKGAQSLCIETHTFLWRHPDSSFRCALEISRHHGVKGKGMRLYYKYVSATMAMHIVKAWKEIWADASAFELETSHNCLFPQ